jgi:SCP-2 sterol transfer family
MATQGSKDRTSHPMEATLLAFGAKVSTAVPRAHGSIVVRCTDTGEAYALEGVGGTPRVNKAPGEGPHQVEVRGPAAVLRAIMEGRQEASRALAAGGIRVRGDLPYLEAMLKDLGLLECP